MLQNKLQYTADPDALAVDMLAVRVTDWCRLTCLCFTRLTHNGHSQQLVAVTAIAKDVRQAVPARQTGCS